ncbi:unnamed protein product [Triticum turgidum subsp. durum]|uniref:Ribosome production factor 2 homolog n=1 Tax=Triticum turgidum subsp. durum TaxID=4567 RepID=A0A9R1NIY7_TRITD|nr:unnamed protein product [Triticum turgidum subsp. durum]
MARPICVEKYPIRFWEHFGRPQSVYTGFGNLPEEKMYNKYEASYSIIMQYQYRVLPRASPPRSQIFVPIEPLRDAQFILLRRSHLQDAGVPCLLPGAKSLQKKPAMRTPGHAKKVKNVTNDAIDGKRGMIYIPDQKISKLTLTKDIKGLKRERRDAKKNKGHLKKQKVNHE